MQTKEAKLIVISSKAPLDEIENVLGKSHVGGHTLGSARANGLVRQQSMWLQKSSANTELLEDLVDEVLDWFSNRRDALRSLDQEMSCKISCKLQVQGDNSCFAINPHMARKLAELNIILLLDMSTTYKELYE